MFKESKFSYSWSIVENEAGKLEDTIDGSIDADDLLRVEHTSNCLSTHQGEHVMDFCEAVATRDGATLEFSGGMPAYASSLRITLDSKLSYMCSFTATYPAAAAPPKWKITKKELRLKSRELQPGSRILGWVSVAFDEIDPSNNRTKSYKIEGYFKPVLQHPKP